MSLSRGFHRSGPYTVVKASVCDHSAVGEKLHINETHKYLLGTKITTYSLTQVFTSISELILMNMMP